MATLYVTEPGSRVEKEYQRLLITREDAVLAEVPIQRISSVVVTGSVGFTTPALLTLLQQGIRVVFISHNGRLRGSLNPACSPDLALQRLQFERQRDEPFCLALSRRIVEGKLENYRTLCLRRLSRQPDADAAQQVLLQRQLARLENALKSTRQAGTLAELRGHEGSGSKAYFYIFRKSLRWKEGGFSQRNKRPPKDPINALLSLGYTLLCHAAVTALEIVQLQPYAGFFHQDRSDRPSLALDLMEEFRPLMVDCLVSSLTNKHMLTMRDFVFSGDGRVRLSRRGLRVFYTSFSRRINAAVTHPAAGRALSYQKCLEVQAYALSQAVRSGDGAGYQSLLVR